MRLCLAAVGVNVACCQRQRRIRRQQPAGFRRKDVRISPDLVNGPRGRVFVGTTRIALPRHDAGIRHVVECITSTHGLGRAAFRDIVDFSDLHSRHVLIFCESRWNEPHVSPPIRSGGENGDLFGFQDQVRFADRPLIRLIEMERRRHVDLDSHVALRCSPTSRSGRSPRRSVRDRP
jgi:hypothetical protein